jgi:hypothetical protein
VVASACVTSRYPYVDEVQGHRLGDARRVFEGRVPSLRNGEQVRARAECPGQRNRIPHRRLGTRVGPRQRATAVRGRRPGVGTHRDHHVGHEPSCHPPGPTIEVAPVHALFVASSGANGSRDRFGSSRPLDSLSADPSIGGYRTAKGHAAICPRPDVVKGPIKTALATGWKDGRTGYQLLVVKVGWYDAGNAKISSALTLRPPTTRDQTPAGHDSLNTRHGGEWSI